MHGPPGWRMLERRLAVGWRWRTCRERRLVLCWQPNRHRRAAAAFAVLSDGKHRLRLQLRWSARRNHRLALHWCWTGRGRSSAVAGTLVDRERLLRLRLWSGLLERAAAAGCPLADWEHWLCLLLCGCWSARWEQRRPPRLKRA